MLLKFFVFAIPIAIGFFFYIYPNLKEEAHVEDCPFCYGREGCSFLYDKLNPEIVSSYFLIGRFSAGRRVYRGWKYNTYPVAIKIHPDPKKLICSHLYKSQENIQSCRIPTDPVKVQQASKDFLNNSKSHNGLRYCTVRNSKSVISFLNNIQASAELKGTNLDKNLTVFSMLVLQSEEMFIRLLKGWRVPQHFGSCGRMYFVEWIPHTLAEMLEQPWEVRAVLAIRVIEMVRELTFSHPQYSFYWTDFSADNIAVDKYGDVMMIDYDHVIIVDRQVYDVEPLHTSMVIEEKSGVMAYDEDAICTAKFSDHNYYAMCNELFYPATVPDHFKGGLLHSTPHDIRFSIQYLIAQCIKPKDMIRFDIMAELSKILEKYLKNF